MAWSKTAPELPNGSAWEQTITKTNFFEQNWFVLSGEYSIARLEGKQFAVRVLVSPSGGSYGNHPEYADLYLRCDIGSVQGTAETPGNLPKTPTYWYFVGEADAGTEITVVYGTTNNSSSQSNGTVKLTAPALLGATVFLRVGGVWKRAQVKVKIGGVWKDAVAKIKAGGTWK